MSVGLADMVLLVEEGNSSTAVAGMAPELELWGKVGSSMSGRAVAAVFAVDNLDKTAPNELSRTMTFSRNPLDRKGGRLIARSVWRFVTRCMRGLNLGQEPGSCFRV